MRGDKLITLIDGKNNLVEVELICAFEISEFNSKYIIYTKNERDREGNAIIYSGKIIVNDDKKYLTAIDNEGECNQIKEIMREMAKYSLEVDNNDK